MLEAIAKRASCRAYKPDPVPEEMVQELVRAALSAPSGNNARPWHLIVVRDPEKRQALSKTHPWAFFCADSPVVIVVAADPRKSEHWWIEDCSAAIENILIQATALGLGSCWVGIRGSEKRGYEREQVVRQVCGIPEHIRVEALVAVGFPAGELRPKGPSPLEAVHYETW
jgi:nitroreductase